ncbi:MAG: hypothetical protein NT117_07450 [Gammaproteobacteria bacterium]|nr:hypothetical protein [Gammaproteobacteria bacterium]
MSPHRSLAAGSIGTDRDVGFPRGRVFVWVPQSVPELETLLYFPRSVHDCSRALVTVHGIARNAMEHALLFSAQAERAGAAIVAPMFSERRFRGYQSLRKRRHQLAPEQAFEAMLEELASSSGLDLQRLSLFGYSGGGQFAHRFALTRPQRVARLAIGAAGWYTFPDRSVAYPQGLAQLPARFPAIDLGAFLRIPVRVFVGDADLQRDEALNQKPEIDQRQGLTRVERARRWVDALRDAAREQGLPEFADLRLLPGVAHSFADAVARCGLDREVFEFHFGSGASASPSQSALPGDAQ